MKKTILLFVIVLTTINICKAQEWMTSLEVAKSLARIQDKMLFVMWEGSSDNAYPIFLNDEKGNLLVVDLFKSDDVNRLIWNHFVPVKIHELMYADLFNQIKDTRDARYLNKFNDDSIKIMDINGNILNTNTSDVYNYNLNLSLFLKQYSLNTSFLKQELSNYSKKKNFTNSFRLASKYLDYAIFSEKGIRFEIIELANIYFDEANLYLTKSNLINKNAFFQKQYLLKIKEHLILNKPKKALRHLKKLDIAEIDKVNQSLYSFLNYTAFKLLKDEENAELWKSKVKVVDLKKAELIINNNT